jgi:hypothetical protein
LALEVTPSIDHYVSHGLGDAVDLLDPGYQDVAQRLRIRRLDNGDNVMRP